MEEGARITSVGNSKPLAPCYLTGVIYTDIIPGVFREHQYLLG